MTQERDKEMIQLTEKKKERLNRGENAATKRWGKTNLEELMEQRDRLHLLVTKFNSIKLVIEGLNFEDEQIRVDGITKFDRAYEELEAYLDNVVKGVKIHKHGETY